MTGATILSAIAASASVLLIFRQTAIQEKQTDIQEEQTGIHKEQTAIQKEQTAIQKEQAMLQRQVEEGRREDAKARYAVRAKKMRHTATRVHAHAAGAFALAERAHFEAMRSNYRSARPMAIMSMKRMRDAHEAALREQTGDGEHPELSEFLDPRLGSEALVMWRAVTQYYAASTVLHSLDEEAVTVMDGSVSEGERLRMFKEDVTNAIAWLVDAQSRAAHIEDATLREWEPDLEHRIALRLADATSYWHAVLGDGDMATQVYAEEERRLERSGASPGREAPEARLLSNHAMALFGRGGPRHDVAATQRLREARRRLRGAAPRAATSRAVLVGAAQAAPSDPDAGTPSHDPRTRSEATFRAAMDRLVQAKSHDRERILRRKHLTVPSMLLFVASFTPSEEDLVELAAEVIGEAEAFLANESIDDSAWLRARGMVRVLDALFVALEHCATDDAGATIKLSERAIDAAARLATIREEPDVAARGGDFGAFACAVALGRAHHGDACMYSSSPRRVPFSKLARARRMETEAQGLAKSRPDRRTSGRVLDAELRGRIEKLVEHAEGIA